MCGVGGVRVGVLRERGGKGGRGWSWCTLSDSHALTWHRLGARSFTGDLVEECHMTLNADLRDGGHLDQESRNVLQTFQTERSKFPDFV